MKTSNLKAFFRRGLGLAAGLLFTASASPASARMLPLGLPELRIKNDVASGPKLAGLPERGAFLVWQSSGGMSEPPPDAPLMARRQNADGSQSHGRVLVEPGSSDFDVVGDGEGGWLLVWADLEDRVGKRILGRWFDSEGLATSEEMVLSSPPGPNTASSEPAAACAQGRCVVVWSHFETGIGSRMRARFFEGHTPDPAGEVELQTEVPFVGLQAALSPDGTLALTWLRGRTVILFSGTLSSGSLPRAIVVTVTEPVLRLFDAAGAPLGPARVLDDSQPPPSPVIPPRTAATSLGVTCAWNDQQELVAVWHRSYDPPRGNAIRLQRFGADGEPLGPFVRINADDAGLTPKLVWQPEEQRFALAWQNLIRRQPDHTGLALLFLGPAAEPLGAPLEVATPPIAPWPWGLELALAGPDHLWTAWASPDSTAPSAAAAVLGWQSGEPVACPACVRLLGDRFTVFAAFRGSEGESVLAGANTPNARTAVFTFRNPANPELFAKMLDGRPVNGHFWFFHGALSNQEYLLGVWDSVTGATRLYSNPRGRLASAGDTMAFEEGVALADSVPFAGSVNLGEPLELILASSVTPISKSSPCVAGPTRLCFLNGRFEATVTWRTAQGAIGSGQAVALSDQGGWFTFFHPDNLELALKVLDGRAVNGHFWVFYASLTNVEFTLRVTDHETGEVWERVNPLRTFASVADTSAF